SGSTNVVAINNGAGQFTVPGSVFTLAGSYTITITGIISISGGCTNLNENASTTFDVLPSPIIKGADLSAGDICVGTDNVVSITDATSLTDGNYTIMYELSGAATGTFTTSVAFAGGASSFTISGATLASEGTVTITIQQLISN